MKSDEKEITISAAELRKRLKKSMGASEIEDFITSYLAAGKELLPDMEAIGKIAEKKKQTNELKVAFNLSQSQFDVLTEHFEHEGASGTELVRKALAQFVSEIGE